MGKIRKEITHFCNRNLNQLLLKKIGLFACCYTPNGTEGFFETLFPVELLNHASYVTTVGGKMDYEKMNFLYRKLFQSLKKIDGFNEVSKRHVVRLSSQNDNRPGKPIQNCSKSPEPCGFPGFFYGKNAGAVSLILFGFELF